MIFMIKYFKSRLNTYCLIRKKSSDDSVIGRLWDLKTIDFRIGAIRFETLRAIVQTHINLSKWNEASGASALYDRDEHLQECRDQDLIDRNFLRCIKKRKQSVK